MNTPASGQPVQPIRPPGAPAAPAAHTPAPAASAAAAPAAAPTSEEKPQEAKPKKEKKAKKPPAEGAPVRTRLFKPPDEHVITLLRPNAKSRNSGDRFNEYRTGMTVKEYVDLIHTKFGRSPGQVHADFRWDLERKFIHIGPTVVEIPKSDPVPVAAEPATQPATKPAA
jgi:hypothetical protein